MLVGEFLPDRFISSVELLEDSMVKLGLQFVFLMEDCDGSVNTLPFLSTLEDLILIGKEK